jgi:uncharacterized protein YggE
MPSNTDPSPPISEANASDVNILPYPYPYPYPYPEPEPSADQLQQLASKVYDDCAERSARVVKQLQQLKGIRKLETHGISVQPLFEYTGNGVQRTIGYMAYNSISFRIDTNLAAETTALCIKFGATSIDGVSFIATEEAVEAGVRAAMHAATKKANERAALACAALGFVRTDYDAVELTVECSQPRETEALGGKSMPMAMAMDAHGGARGGGFSMPVLGVTERASCHASLVVSA